MKIPKDHVLVLRTCDRHLKSHGGFQWPKEGEVSAPDWSPKAACGTGLHGWLWGQGDYSLRNGDAERVWLVLEVEEKIIVKIDNGEKVKFPKAKVVYCGNWIRAFEIIRESRPKPDKVEAFNSGYSGHASATGYSGHASATGYSGHASATGYSGHASATGDSGHASATGDSGHASATGNYGHASATGDSGHASATGYYGHASATGYSGHASATGYSGHASATGYSGHASATGNSGHASATGDSGHASATGNYGHASATGYSGHASATGYSGHASATGDYGIGCGLGNNSKARSGKNGAVILTHWVEKEDRYRVVVGYVGEDGIKGDTWYLVVDGKLSEVK